MRGAALVQARRLRLAALEARTQVAERDAAEAQRAAVKYRIAALASFAIALAAAVLG